MPIALRSAIKQILIIIINLPDLLPEVPQVILNIRRLLQAEITHEQLSDLSINFSLLLLFQLLDVFVMSGGRIAAHPLHLCKIISSDAF